MPDEYEIEIVHKERDPSLVYPLDVSKAKMGLFEFSRLPLDDQSTLSIAVAVGINKTVTEWLKETFDYMPWVQLLQTADGKFEAYLMHFRSQVDATLFRVRFGHLF